MVIGRTASWEVSSEKDPVRASGWPYRATRQSDEGRPLAGVKRNGLRGRKCFHTHMMAEGVLSR